MALPDAGVCRTCLSSKPKLLGMDQAVPNLERMTYSDILDFCTNVQNPMEQRRLQTIKYPPQICLRCSKALEVSYHFLKMVQNTDKILEEEQQVVNQLNVEDEVEQNNEKKEAPALMNFAQLIDNKQLLAHEMKLTVNQEEIRKPIAIAEPIAMISGVQKDLHSIEDNQFLKLLSENESPSKELWNNNIIKSDLSSLAELKDFDWIDKVTFGSIIGTYRNPAESTDDSDTVDSGGKAEHFNPMDQSDNLPNEILATKVNVPYENQLTKDFQKKNSITKAVENAESLAKLMLIDFVDDLQENDMCDYDSVLNSEETTKLGENDKLTNETNENHTCKLCNETFTDKNEYTRHLNTHKDITPVRCKHCNYYSCYPESMRKHYEKVHKEVPTFNLLAGPVIPIKPPAEQKYYAKTYRCSKCSKETHKRRDIRTHLIIKHQVTLSNADSFIQASHNCPECSRTFRNQRGMRYHFIRAHGKQKLKPTGVSFPCPKCAKVFAFNQSLLKHQKTCEGMGEVQCHLCNKKHDTAREFELHLCKEHGVNKTHQCGICSKTFKNSQYLAMHQKRHTDRNFQCQQCPKKYVNKTDLRVHMERIHNTEIKAQCAACGASFTSSCYLRAHEAKVHNKKQYICSHCGFEATTVSRLKLHRYKHFGMPYRCTQCDKGFAFRSFMRRHALSMHQISFSDIDMAEMFKKNMGYPSRYDVFSNAEYSLELPEVLEEDIEQELSEFGLNFNDIMRDLFNEKDVKDNI